MSSEIGNVNNSDLKFTKLHKFIKRKSIISFENKTIFNKKFTLILITALITSEIVGNFQLQKYAMISSDLLFLFMRFFKKEILSKHKKNKFG